MCWATWFLKPERTACCSAYLPELCNIESPFVLFLQPLATDINLSLDILNLFGQASGQKTNVQKSNVFPIQCSENDMAFIQDHQPCELLDFPCKYLRVPLSLRKLTKAQLQPFIDSIAAGAGWKADLLTKRKVAYTGAACTSTVVYIVMDIDLPPWAIKAIDRLRRGFLWRGRKEA